MGPSPVERISGPSSESAPGKRANGSTSLLDPDVGGLGGPEVEADRVDPVISSAAALATGRPVTFSTNGTERLARGLASRTRSRHS